MNHPHKKRKISILQKELERKNQEEIAHIDIQSILEERKQSSEL